MDGPLSSSDVSEGATFLKGCNMPLLVNEMMIELMRVRPEDPVECLKKYLDTVDKAKYKPGAAKVEPAAASPAAEAAAAPAEEEEGEMHDLSDLSGDLHEAIKKAVSEGHYRLDLSKNRMSQLPEELLNNEKVVGLSVEENQLGDMDGLMTMPNLRELNISDNSPFKTFPEGFAEKLPHLEKIDAYKCSFSGAMSDELCKLKSLTYLNLFNNGLLKLSPNLSELENLTELNLSSNKIMQIQPNLLNGLKNLRRLSLFWNRIIRVPSLAPLVSLKELQLNGNQLPEMPELGVHENIGEINLSENKITTLHESLFKQTNLECFMAGKNQLTDATLLTGWTNLTNLKKIQLPRNELTTILPEWLTMPNLVCLELDGNKIAELPENMGDFETKGTPLTFLFLAENLYTKLPASMGTMTSLKRIALRASPLDLSDSTTKTTYEKVAEIIKTKGVDGKFLDNGRNTKPRAPAGPATLSAGPSAGSGPASMGTGEAKEKKPAEGVQVKGEVCLSIN